MFQASSPFEGGHFDHFFCDDVGVVGVTKARPAGVAGQLGAGNCHNTSEKLNSAALLCSFLVFLSKLVFLEHSIILYFFLIWDVKYRNPNMNTKIINTEII